MMSKTAIASRLTLSTILVNDPIVRKILDRWDRINLPDAWLAAGCITSAVWNKMFGFRPGHGLSDIDIIYCDPNDLREATEAYQAAEIRRVLSDLSYDVDVKNEARVHLWYEGKFGYPVEPYRSSSHAIETFPTIAGSIGIRPVDDGLEIVAPFGLDDLLSGTVRPNKRLIDQAVYEAKAQKWRRHWPDLYVIAWDQE